MPSKQKLSFNHGNLRFEPLRLPEDGTVAVRSVATSFAIVLTT